MSKRALLPKLKSDELRDSTVTITSDAERSRYRLITPVANQGAMAATWKARLDGVIQRTVAIKFSQKDDSNNHPLYLEASHVAGLPSELFAQLLMYGTPEFEVDLQLPEGSIDATVVEWVEGETLTAFLGHDRGITAGEFLSLCEDLCDALSALELSGLHHSDFRDDNIIIHEVESPIKTDPSLRIKVIDTGSLRTPQEHRRRIIDWKTELATLEALSGSEEVRERIESLKRLIAKFSPTDRERAISHVVACFNALRRRSLTADARTQRFVQSLPQVIERMLDTDAGESPDEPNAIKAALTLCWSRCSSGSESALATPFDLPYAELIYDNRQLMDLFSDKYPNLSECRSNSPTYLYGPRGCGKSTVLRSLSMQALLSSADPSEELTKVPFFGVYVCCSMELKSRYSFLRDEDFSSLESNIVRHFILLLLCSLIRTVRFSEGHPQASAINLGATQAGLRSLCDFVSERLFSAAGSKTRNGQYRVSTLNHLQARLDEEREYEWQSIVVRRARNSIADSSPLFDVCKELTRCCPGLQSRRIVFLLDDYSAQRIPAALQQRLNRAITFAKDSCPLFKVTSEYGGVDLTGLNSSREVREVNVGAEHLSLSGSERWQFLGEVIDRRFEFAARADVSKFPRTAEELLGMSGVQPAKQMAREIKSKRNAFYYHGLDTLSDLCSGDFATALDIMQRMTAATPGGWKETTKIPPRTQHEAIKSFASGELRQLLLATRLGERKYEVVDRLAWVSHELAVTKVTADGDPVVKTHVDIDNAVLTELRSRDPDLHDFFFEMVRGGLLFPLQISRSSSQKDVTQRFMVRRILLAQHRSPLGRHTPIKFTDVSKLISFLRKPSDWAKIEVRSDEVDPRENLFGEIDGHS